MIWSEVYEHPEEGEIEVIWSGSSPERTHLIAIQADLWTTEEAIADCFLWARNLSEGKGYDPA